MCDERVIPTDAVNSRYWSNGGPWRELTLNGSVAAANNDETLMAPAA
jgi:hypothetical protein